MIDVPVEVKDALRDGRLKKNYRIVVLDDEGAEDFTIDNNNLVSETINIDERMCSGDKIKFGLCEGSSLEFQYFGFPSILGRRLQVFIDVDYGSENPYVIPIGYFDVQKCSRQASTGIIKVTAYNKLMSDYLDVNANKLIEEDIINEDNTNSMSLYSLLNVLLENYSIDTSVPEQFRTDGWNNPFSVSSAFTYELFSSNKVSLGRYLHFAYVRDYINDWDVYHHYLSAKASEELVQKVTDMWATFFENAISVVKNSYIKIGHAGTEGRDYIYAPLKEAIETANYESLLVPQYYEPNYWALKGTIYWGRRSSSLPIDYAEAKVGLLEYNSDNLTLPFHYDENMRMNLEIPLGVWVDTEVQPSTANINSVSLAWTTDFIQNYGNVLAYVYKKNLTPMEEYRVTIDDFNTDVTIRELQSAVFETNCQFGQLDRVSDLFSGVELNHSRLYPQETLYPDNALYPEGAQASATRAMYSKLWADEGNVHKWRYLIITYKGLDGEGNEKDFVYTAEVNSDGTDDYDCSDNWLFRNLVWTQAQIEEYADTMVTKMQDMTWFPFEMWCAGLPYLETGDEIEIPLGQNSYTSYVLQRQLKGIQNLQDTYINGTLDIF